MPRHRAPDDPTRLLSRESRGQASVELIAIVPAFGAVVLVVAQLLVIGWAEWSAASAARAGARADVVGVAAERVTRSALPGLLRRGSQVEVGERVRVEVRVPRLIPGIEPAPARAESGLRVSDG